MSLLLLRQNYSLALQRPTGQTALLQALALGQMRSNDYSTTEIFVDNFLLLSIMSTNRFSPIHNQTKRFKTGNNVRSHKNVFISVSNCEGESACLLMFFCRSIMTSPPEHSLVLYLVLSFVVGLC